MFEVEVDNYSGFFSFEDVHSIALAICIQFSFCYQCPFYVVVLDGE
jgi:hypothetical protein